MDEDIRYWLGIVLVGIAGVIILPFFAIIIGILRIIAFVVDVLAFPYNCMYAYHTKFERNKSISEALKKVCEDWETKDDN